jgi:integrase
MNLRALATAFAPPPGSLRSSVLDIMLGRAAQRARSPLTAAVMATATNTWAQSTVKNRDGLWQRWQVWASNNRAISPGTDLARFVESLRALPSSKMTYAKGLAAIMQRMHQPVPILRLYISGLRATGALIPQRQAVPLCRRSLERLLQLLSPPLQAAALLAWKTASRWNDLLGLKRKSFLLVEPQRVVIRWGETKTSRVNPFAASLWTVVDDDSPARLRPLIQHIESLIHPEAPFLQLSTADLDRWMARQNLEWRAHSFKRGALNVLMRHLAETQDERLKALIPLLAKHAHPIQAFPSTTLGYVTDHVNTALALNTQAVTRLL